MQKTLILGGGIRGIVASNILKKAMGQDMQVTVCIQDLENYTLIWT